MRTAYLCKKAKGGGKGGEGGGGGGTKEAPIYTYTDIQPALLINPHVETIWLV